MSESWKGMILHGVVWSGHRYASLADKVVGYLMSGSVGIE